MKIDKNRHKTPKKIKKIVKIHLKNNNYSHKTLKNDENWHKTHKKLLK